MFVTEPYQLFQRTHQVQEVVCAGEDNIGEHVSIAGRILSQRKMGNSLSHGIKLTLWMSGNVREQRG